jgi:2-desacetyl-2-hydroxyethyl bacteriochlorophyllide A dehydrogenase
MICVSIQKPKLWRINEENTMKRAVITEPKCVVVEEVPDPVPGPDEVLLDIAYAGICGSDMHAFLGEHPYIPLPATPGHEFSATVSSVGEGVKDLKPGDRVVCEPNLVCGVCYNCRIGRYNICDNLRVMGCQGDGAMADKFVAPAEKTIRIPDRVSLRDAVLVEPLAVGVHAVRRAGDLFGKNVAVLGAGTIGLMVIACLDRAGASRIIATDVSEPRLELAEHMGATEALNADSGNVVEQILAEQVYEGIDVVFECVGVEKSIRDAMSMVRKGGRIVVCGVFGSETTVPMVQVQDRELELIGTIMYIRRDITDAIGMLAGGMFDTSHFLGDAFPLERAQEAFQASFDTAHHVKVLFKIA